MRPKPNFRTQNSMELQIHFNHMKNVNGVIKLTEALLDGAQFATSRLDAPTKSR